MFNLPWLEAYYKVAIDALDFILVYLLTYRLFLWLRQSHAMNLIKGLFLLLLVFLGSHALQLNTLNWILEKSATVLMVLVVIVFQPELRRFLERIGSTGNVFSASSTINEFNAATFVQQIIKAIDNLSKEKIGAIVVLEGEIALDRYYESGVLIDGDVHADMLASICWPGSPLHDGAIIIKDYKVKAASCYLPLTETPIADRRLGTRHRAAMGLSDLSDAFIIVVSEESGVISVAENGSMTRYLNKDSLGTLLFNKVQKAESARTYGNQVWRKWFSWI